MITKKFDRYYKTVSYLEGLSNLPLKGDYMIDRQNLGVHIKRMRYLLNCIGNPDRGIKFIHVAGTAGKGSVTNMLHEVLREAGKKVGSFTSPFVTTSIEKIKVGDLYIDPEIFSDIVDELKPVIDNAYMNGPYDRPSYFEIFLAIAFVYFKRQKCEWVVLEVGLGGRFDSTNVIENPAVTAITVIDYDHTEILGKTLKEIGYDKAGIIKKDSHFFTTETRPSLRKLFQSICDSEKAKMDIVLPVTVPGKSANYKDKNVALVKAISKHLGISESKIEEGLKCAKLQCRFEVVQRGPAVPTVVLDGAHNRSKIESTIANLQLHAYKKLHVVIGIAASKDSLTMLKQIIPLADTVQVTRFQVKDRKCAHPKELMERSKKYAKRGTKFSVFLDPNCALDNALKTANQKDLILVVGSFFLAGELRKKWFPESTVLARRKLQSHDRV